jgi:ion channel-forming bestrophin family protein
MSMERQNWLRVATQLKGSVIPHVYKRVLGCGLFGVFISCLHFYKIPVSYPILGTIVPSIVLGLLLVFRTNTAYDRFWEGRRLWGNMNNGVRNLSRQMWVNIATATPEDRAKKIVFIRLLVAFAIATKLHLRDETTDQEELQDLIPTNQYFQLKNFNNPPLEIAFWIGDYLQQQYQRNCINSYQLEAMQKLLDSLVDVLGGCERILRTPMPLAYAIHLKQLLLIYCLLLPFQLVNSLQWMTGLLVGLISFTLLGIEEIGIEIENPFGYDDNDLPLDRFCASMRHNLEDLITLNPSVSSNSKE